MAIMFRIPITLDKAAPDINVAFLLIKKIHIWVSIDRFGFCLVNFTLFSTIFCAVSS